MADTDCPFAGKSMICCDIERPENSLSSAVMRLMVCLVLMWLWLLALVYIIRSKLAKMAECVEDVRQRRPFIPLTFLAAGFFFSCIFIKYYIYVITDVNEEPPFEFINMGDEEIFGAYD